VSRQSKRHRTDSSSDSAGDWMNTYADMVTLLLTFFILLFSMATVDKQKFVELANSLRSAFMHENGGGDLYESNRGSELINIYDEINAVDKVVSLVNNDYEGGETDNNVDRITDGNEVEYNTDDLKAEIEKAIEEMGLEEYVKIIERKDFLILRFDSVILFDLSSADIKSSAKTVLEKLGQMLNKMSNEIIIQGHTDNLPINTGQFPSNWELSTRRATNVVHFFINECSIAPSRLTATGNAEYKPVKPNDTAENRQQNRRIDIVVSKD